MILSILSWLIVIVYILLILRFYYAWIQMNGSKETDHSLQKISIVIAIRNEEENLKQLFNSILKLNYPKSHFELICINDHSEDSSLELLELFRKNNPDIDMTILSLDTNEKGKKAALKKAYTIAKHDIIQCTDGDCILPINWLQYCSSAFSNREIKLLSGGIKLGHDVSVFQKIQALELMSLIASGGAAIGSKNPIMSNGANMAFRKEILDNVSEDALHSNLASGDDVFLLQKVKQAYGPTAISFIKNPDYWVTTKPERDIKAWINQRIRWVSKSSGYSDRFLIITSLFVFLSNFVLILLFISSFFHIQHLVTLGYLSILKTITDFIFLKQSAKDSSQVSLLKWFVPFSFIYPFFISYSAIAGQFMGFTWKNRVYKK